MKAPLVAIVALSVFVLLVCFGCVTNSIIPKQDIAEIQAVSKAGNSDSYGCFTGVIRGSSRAW
jgi:hypothetical protein